MFYQATGEIVLLEYRAADADEQKARWEKMPPAMQLWLISRLNPLEGFWIARKIWGSLYNTFEEPVSPNFIRVLDWLEDFVSSGGKLKNVLAQELERVGYAILSEERNYSLCTQRLVGALAYARQVNHHPGWYPGTAFALYLAAKNNLALTDEIARQYLERPVV
jgi:hypothetical protein